VSQQPEASQVENAVQPAVVWGDTGSPEVAFGVRKAEGNESFACGGAVGVVCLCREHGSMVVHELHGSRQQSRQHAAMQLST